MRVSVIGSGVTGQASGMGLVKKGHKVTFYDIDKTKLAALKDKGYSVTEDILSAVKDSEILFICVPTPTVDKGMDFSMMQVAIIEIAKALGEVRQYRVVVVRSTVVPSTTRCRVMPLLEKHSGLKAGPDFGLCMNPEFLREKCAAQDFLEPSRIIIGELDKRSGDAVEMLYENFSAPIFRMDMDHAEMVKYVSNLFLACKISYFNEIFMISKELGIDPDLISRVVAVDPRIGEYGIHGGRPFGGTCLPKDLKAFIGFVKGKKINPKLLNVVLQINEDISSHAVEDNRDQ